MNPTASRKALIAELERNRARFTGDLADLGDSLNVTQRFQNSVRRYPERWIGGGIVAGMVFSRLLVPRRGRRNEKGRSGKGSLFLGLLGLAAREIFRLSTPALRKVAQQQFDEWVTERHSQTQGDDDEPGDPTNEST